MRQILSPLLTKSMSPPMLQRKCDCGQHTIEGECDSCRKKREGALQRFAGDADRLSDIPPVVHQVLRGAGEPLDPGTRRTAESRFGRDFSTVRIHTGEREGASARAIRARAYTFGSHIVFGSGEYRPGTRPGQKLLTHELAHVVQQSGHVNLQASGGIARDEGLEREAEAAAESIDAEGVFPINRNTVPAIARDQEDAGVNDHSQEQNDCVKGLGGCTLPGGIPSSGQIRGYNKECRTRTGYSGPDVSPCGIPLDEATDAGAKPTLPAPAVATNNAGRALTDAEKKAIQAATAATPPAAARSFAQGPKFVLHDTAGIIGQPHMDELKKAGRGPLGESASAYVPTSGAPTIARPDFFDSKRPTASNYEKANDVVSQPDREAAFRKIWKATKPSEKQPALDSALNGLGLTPEEIKKEQTGARKQLDANSGKIFTSAAWTIGEVCRKVAGGVDQVAASKASEADLTAGCSTAKPYFEAREARVGSEVNIEINQVVNSDCSTKAKDLQPLPPYTADQYKSVASLYLQAAVQAGQFPEITTHFLTDANVRGHCDPRCFHLGRLYDEIAASLGHPKGSTYGPAPSYGTKYGTNNVWWLDKVCGGPHP